MADKTIGDYSAAASIDGTNHYLLIQPGNASTAYNRINRSVFLGVTGQPADISTIQSLTNKTLDNTNTITLKDTLFTLQDDGDTSKQAKFQLSGITTATTRTYTLPNASSTLADIATAQTFTNKTLTAPAISGGTIDNSTITVDAIGEHTVANGVTIDGLNIKDGALNTNNSVITSNITDSAVTPAKLVSGTGSGWTWQSWIPTWVNLTVGNGVSACTYTQVGKTVICRLNFTFGTTSAMSSSPTFSLPITSVSAFAGVGMTLGVVRILDAGTAGYLGSIQLISATTATIIPQNSSSTYVTDGALSSTVPMTWTTNDGLYGIFIYEAL